MNTSIGGGLTQQELDIENYILELSKVLDNYYNVKEFEGVLITAISRHAELIEEQEVEK